MSRRVGPYATIKELESVAALVKQLQPGASIAYSLQVSDNGTVTAKKPRAKSFTCPECGQKFETPQALGPHSRAHKRAAEKAKLPVDAEASAAS